MGELIEQLGGYEQAKRAIENNVLKGYAPYTYETAHRELLKYRREHNIFEVGDKVVHPKFGDTRLYEVREVKGSLVLVYFDRLSYSFNSDLRHATDEEIKQGRRL